MIEWHGLAAVDPLPAKLVRTCFKIDLVHHKQPFPIRAEVESAPIASGGGGQSLRAAQA